MFIRRVYILTIALLFLILCAACERKKGTVNVEAVVLRALPRLYIDGDFCGHCPAKIRLPEGLHTIEVKAVDYRDYVTTLTVLADSEQTLIAQPRGLWLDRLGSK